MEKRHDEERWVLANSVKSNELVSGGGKDEEDDDEEEEALSLCDLPIMNQKSRKEREEEEEISPLARGIHETQEDFDFCSLSKESKMCAADEVFFQGQILPLRHSVSSEKSLLMQCGSMTRSESMDHCYSGGLISSRSSSISSHQSSSSGSSTTTTTTTTTTRRRHPKPPRNQFHSHPSPSPRILHSSTKNHRILNSSCSNIPNPNKKSSVWSILRLGLVTPPPEIAFQDMKTRNRVNCKSFGSRNSTSSNSSSGGGSARNAKSEEKTIKSKKSKRVNFLNGCKCSVNDAVPSRIVIIKRSASESEETRVLRLEEEEEEEESVQPTKMIKRQENKKRLSHHRTFEWLKQLSIEEAGDDDDDRA